MRKQKGKKVVLSALLIGCLLLIPSYGKRNTKPVIQVKTDPRIELMSLIFHLAGNPEYRQGRIKSYNQDVHKYFAAVRNHDVVKLAAELRETRGISFDAVMGMAVHLEDAFSLEERIPFLPQPDTLDRRWTPESARKFLQAARRFVKDSKFKAFIEAHAAFYDLATTRMQAVMEKHSVVDWLDEFFGARPGAKFEIILGMLNGPASYGPRIKLSENDEILCCVLGVWETDKQGSPKFSQQVLPTVVHEFCHSYCNPLVDKHEAELKDSAEEIYQRVGKAMSQMAYGNWQTMMRESLVRASVIRYLLDAFGKEEAQKEIESEKSRQFFWIGELSELLGEYEQSRTVYASLDDFFPKISEFFNTYVDRMDEGREAFAKGRQERLEKLKASSPKIVSMVPPNGALDVDPNLKSIIVTFDRPMKDKHWAVMQLSDKFPDMNGEVFYDETRTIFTIPVKLKSDTEYEFGLNADGYYAFASEKGDILYPVMIRFKTRKKELNS